MKYYFVCIDERIGEVEFAGRCVMRLEDDACPEAYIEQVILPSWRGEGAEADESGIWHYGDGITACLESAREIPASDFLVLRQHITLL